MKYLITSLLGLALSCNLTAATSITSSTVSGHWTISGSPYKLFNSVTINYGDSLTIDPGVQVIFQGQYMMDVNGSLKATGTTSQPILFTINDTTGMHISTAGDNSGGWQGIRFASVIPADHSSFRNCIVEYMKNGSVSFARSMNVSGCTFRYNKCVEAAVTNMLYMYSPDSTVNYEISNCRFYSNTILAAEGVRIDNNFKSSLYAHDNELYDNTLSRYGSLFWVTYSKLNFSNNKVYRNGNVADSGAYNIVYAIGSTAVMQGNKIYENVGYQQGAVSVHDCKLDLNRNYICNNQAILGFTGDASCGATEGGGGIRISGSWDAGQPHYRSVVRNNIIANNAAGFAGGGIYLFYAVADVMNNHIVNNTGLFGGGIYLMNYPGNMGASSVRIRNNLFRGNYSTTPPGDTVNLWVEAADTLYYDHNFIGRPVLMDVINNSFGIATVGDTMHNVIGTDPGMTAPTHNPDVYESALAADFRLLSTSACVNMGDNTIVAATPADYAGNVRIHGPLVDIGAYEYGAGPAWLAVKQSIGTGMHMQPNPATNLLFITTPVAAGWIALYDLSGRMVQHAQVAAGSTLLDVALVPRGPYIVVWTNGSEVVTGKVILE